MINKVKNIEISGIKKNYSFFKYIIPFQSINQFFSFILFISFGFLAIVTVLKISGSTAPYLIILIPALMAGAGPLFGVLPAELTISNNGLVRFEVADVEKIISSMEYKKFNDSLGNTYHRINAKRIFRWKENEITLISHSEKIFISGPIFIMESLEKRIINFFNEIPL